MVAWRKPGVIRRSADARSALLDGFSQQQAVACHDGLPLALEQVVNKCSDVFDGDNAVVVHVGSVNIQVTLALEQEVDECCNVLDGNHAIVVDVGHAGGN